MSDYNFDYLKYFLEHKPPWPMNMAPQTNKKEVLGTRFFDILFFIKPVLNGEFM